MLVQICICSLFLNKTYMTDISRFSLIIIINTALILVNMNHIYTFVWFDQIVYVFSVTLDHNEIIDINIV